MVFWGYAEGSRIARPFMMQVKIGLKEWPELYLVVASCIIGNVLFSWRVWKEEKSHLWTTRFKHVYTVYRPYDERLKCYPKPWVTDSRYLPDDHPMSPIEISWYNYPPVEVHRNDPHMRGPSLDGKEPVQKPFPFNWKWIPGLTAEREAWKKSLIPQQEEKDK